MFRKQTGGKCVWSGVSKVWCNGRALHRAAAELAPGGSRRSWRGLDFYTESEEKGLEVFESEGSMI